MFGLVMAILIANPQAAAQMPTISVVVKDDAGVPAEWLRQANNELERIYREIDVSIVWWDPNLPSSRGDEATVPRNLLSIAIRRNAVSLQKKLSDDAMGITSGTAFERGRVAYVFYGRMEQFTPLYRGKYLGHFMAHELGHLLLPQYSHSSTGLMRARWNRDDLERAQHGQLRFTPEQARLIRFSATRIAAAVGDASKQSPVGKN
jgi:hypothetical protein